MAARLASLPLLPTGVPEEVVEAEVGGASACPICRDAGVKSGSGSDGSATGNPEVWARSVDGELYRCGAEASHLHPPSTSSAGPASADETSSLQWLESALPGPGLAGPGQQAWGPSSPWRRQI